MKVRERFFVINRYPGKNGIRSVLMNEFPTHEEATLFAYYCVNTLLNLTGNCLEEFIVFVGSKTKVEKVVNE